MQEQKEVPKSEVSLKYMAWNVKEISEQMKRLVTIMESISTSMRSSAMHKMNVGEKEDEIPF